MHFSIEEQSFTDTETGVRYTFGVNRADSALVTITASYEDGHTRVWTYGRNAGLKSEESFPAGEKNAVPATTHKNEMPSGGAGVRTSGPAGRVNTTSSLSGKK